MRPARWVALLLVLLTAVAGTMTPTTAHAAEEPATPACPVAPAPSGGTDYVVREVRLLRIDVASACAAQRADSEALRALNRKLGADAHQDAIDTRVAIRAAADQAHADAPKASTAGTTRETPMYTAAAQPDTGDQTVALSNADVVRLDSGFRTINGAVWALIGVLLLVPFAIALNRWFTTT